MELDLRDPAISRIQFSQQPIGRVLFLSERDLGDLALVHEGGTIWNRWDLPLRASGKPFGFEPRWKRWAFSRAQQDCI